LTVFAQVDLNNGLIAYYPFNGNANDASGNGNNPVFNNASLATDVYGNPNSAYYFNGIDNYMEIPNSASLNMGTTISICAWVKPAGFYYGACHGNSVIMKGNSDFLTGNYMLRFDDALYTGTNCNGGIPDTLHQTYYGIGTGLSPVQDTPYAQKNIWRSVVYTYDGLHAKLYIDCDLVLDTEQPGLSFTNGDNLFFGKLNNAQFPYWLNGVLDEVRIYNRVLNADEVKAYSYACVDKSPCSNWLKVNQGISGVQIGDLDVSGDQLTVEALINRTTSYPDLYDGGDVVSKHDNPGDNNYLLRPTVAQITTANGFFQTDKACNIELNKTYHIAMVYDGKTLKFYRNGFLMSVVQASGNLYQNDWITKIGTTANTGSPYPADFIGYINEVRIWNVARSQDDIKKYMNQSLPNPASQTGLLAYFTFDDLKNKQGNSQWDGSILGDAEINQTNPTCSSFIADSCSNKTKSVIAGFTGPDTTCINSPVQLTNTSVGASNYYWSFCTAGFNTTPQADNLGNPGNLLNAPVFMDFILDDNGNYYGFVTSNTTGEITKLDYGNSLLNTPKATNPGNFNGVIPTYEEGIQVKKFNGKCYAFVVAAADVAGNGSVLIRLDFGSSFSNTPTATSLGNIGGLFYPHDLFIASEDNNFYGFTINIRDNTITRFDFGNDLGNQPNGVNLGSIGDFDYPCGFSFVNTGGNWYAFVANRDNNSITRLDFGNSLLNVPTGTNMGNPGNFLYRPRDISIFQSCEGVVGLVVNEEDETTGTITKLDFGSDVLSNPQAGDLGNQGSLRFPHSISKFFLEGNDIYSFITNVKNNTITRLRYVGCTNTNISSSTNQTPPPVIYTTPGVYNINLLLDIGLPTQTSFCKQIVVLNCDTTCNLKADFKYLQNACDPRIIRFHSTTLNADSIWWDFGNGKTAGNFTDTAIQYAAPGNYTAKLFAKTNAGCLDTTEYTVNVNVLKDSAIVNRDTSICAGAPIQLKAIKGLNYCWSPSAGLSNPSMQNPIASPSVSTKYYLHVLTDSSKPVILDSVTITVIPPPDVSGGKDASVCKGDSVQLNATGAVTYNWNASAYLSDTIIANPVAAPVKTTSFIVKGYNAQGCTGIDTVEVVVLALPQIALTSDTAVCTGGSVSLEAKSSGKNIYNWTPLTGLLSPGVYNPVASPVNPTKYFVKVTDENHCTAVDSVMVDVLPIPKVSALNDTSVCLNASINLTSAASDATIFTWSPSTGLDDPGVQNPNASPAISTLYTVVAGNGICSDKDSVLVSVLSLPNVKATNDTTVCGNASVQLSASGAISYVWNPSVGLSNATVANPVASPGTTTTYFVKGTGSNSCANTDSVRIVVNPPAAFDIKPQHASICLGDTVLLIASGGDIYGWSPARDITNTSSAYTKVYPARHTTYSVAITNTVCKVTSVLTSDIVVKDLPVVAVSKSNDIDCLNFEAQLQVTGGTNYSWYPSTYISNIHISNPVVNPPSDTRYFVKATDINGCGNKDSILVLSNTNNSDKAKFEIASAFTPNHDGVNDCFSVRYWGPADLFDMSIYNRFGQLVYHSKSTSNCWDGTFNGQPQPMGTYVYVITASTRCSNGVLHKKGILVLIR
jgi:gliding motility-associated-like protein